VLAVEYAPQLAVLDHAAVMVNHGGANSVQECISRGKPMLVIPLTYEQQLLASFVVQAGVGAALDRREVTVEKCRALLLPLLSRESPERARAVELSARAGNGAARVAELLNGVGDRNPRAR
jgi:UDP:flavonoid glycosyltransferase YjiC (YdhE family)